MVGQRSGHTNLQHGDTYLSPARSTAIRYAVNKRYGSELLSYTLDFLQELLRRKIPGVADDLFHDYPEMFNLLDVSCAPLLIGVQGAVVDELVAEKGGDAAPVFNHVLATIRENPDRVEISCSRPILGAAGHPCFSPDHLARERYALGSTLS